MNIEEQVLSVNQARHLQSLGMDMSDASVWFIRLSNTDYWKPIFKTENCVKLYNNKKYHDCYCPTYTLQEVIDKLPRHIVIDDYDYYLEMNNDYWMCYYRYTYSLDGDERDYIEESNYQGNNFKDVAYNILCWVIENGYLIKGK